MGASTVDTSPVFHGCHVLFHGVEACQRLDLQPLIEQNGGSHAIYTRSSSVTAATLETILVVGYWVDFLPVVDRSWSIASPYWLHGCIKHQRRLPLDRHAFFRPPVWHLPSSWASVGLTYPMEYDSQAEADKAAVEMPYALTNALAPGDAEVPLWPYAVASLRRPMEDTDALIDTLSRLSRMPTHSFTPLEMAINELMVDSERARFFEQVLPQMVELVLQLPLLFPQPPKLLYPVFAVANDQAKESPLSVQTTSLTKIQVLALLGACMFGIMSQQGMELAPFDGKEDPFYAEFPTFDMTEMFVSGYRGRKEVKAQKIHAFFHYLLRAVEQLRTQREDMNKQVISYSRISLCEVPRKEGSPTDQLISYAQCLHHSVREGADAVCPLGLSAVQCETKRLIEDLDEQLQIDFANMYAGGGVFGSGCVQEEIRFILSPELLVSCLLCARLEANEAFVIHGTERYCRYRGYGFAFEYDGDFVDETPFEALCDGKKRRKNVVVGIDAVNYCQFPYEEQFSEEHVMRDILKALVGFAYPDSVAKGWPIGTGNWGCGVFRGNPELKFFIQWLAASIAQRPLTYVLLSQDAQLRHGIDEVLHFVDSMRQSGRGAEELFRFVVEFVFHVRSQLHSRSSVFQLFQAFLESKKTKINAKKPFWPWKRNQNQSTHL